MKLYDFIKEKERIEAKKRADKQRQEVLYTAASLGMDKAVVAQLLNRPIVKDVE